MIHLTCHTSYFREVIASHKNTTCGFHQFIYIYIILNPYLILLLYRTDSVLLFTVWRVARCTSLLCSISALPSLTHRPKKLQLTHPQQLSRALPPHIHCGSVHHRASHAEPFILPSITPPPIGRERESNQYTILSRPSYI